MTFSTPPTRPDDALADLAQKPLVLATDLDGTFLGGSARARETLYTWIDDNRDTVGLIFVTGRDLGFIGELEAAGTVPRPDYAVADVGTTIAARDGRTLAPIATLEAEIAAAWGDAGDRVRAALEGLGGISLQATEFRYRISYHMDPSRFDARAVEVVEAMGLDALVSDNRFFDVLPRGVSKGPSLRRLLAQLGVADRRVLVAGDTLNDLSMLASGLPAVAVGNSEPALLARLEGLTHVHRARANGAGGIAEAISAFGYLSQPAA